MTINSIVHNVHNDIIFTSPQNLILYCACDRDSDYAMMVNFQLPSHNIFIFVDCTVHNHHKLCASKIFASLINFPICSTTQFSMCSSAEVCFGFGLQHSAAQYLHWQENKNCNIFYEDEYDKNHSQNFRLPFVEL